MSRCSFKVHCEYRHLELRKLTPESRPAAMMSALRTEAGFLVPGSG